MIGCEAIPKEPQPSQTHSPDKPFSIYLQSKDGSRGFASQRIRMHSFSTAFSIFSWLSVWAKPRRSMHLFLLISDFLFWFLYFSIINYKPKNPLCSIWLQFFFLFFVFFFFFGFFSLSLNRYKVFYLGLHVS